MQVDAVAADADRVRKHFRREFAGLLAEFLRAGLGADVVLGHREHRLDSAALPDVRGHREAVVRAHDLRTQLQPLPPSLAVRPRRVGLHPVKQRKTEILGPLQVPFGGFAVVAVDVAEPVIVLRPVHETDIADAAGEVRRVEDSPIRPQIEHALRRGTGRVEGHLARLERDRVGHLPRE